MPDPQWHIHAFVFNATQDHAEDGRRKVKIRPVMEIRKLLDRGFNQRFSRKMAELGYEIVTSWETDEKGRRYKGWDIKGIPDTVLAKTSRRSQEIDRKEQEIVAAIRESDPNCPTG